MKKPNLNLNFKGDIRIPRPVAELVADLRQRGLLPVAIGLVAVIAAIPVLFSSGSKPAPSSEPTAAVTVAPEAQSLVVAKGETLRDYRSRLARRAAKDPFVQKYVAPDVAVGKDGGAATSLESIPVGGSSAGGTSGAGGASSKPKPSSPQKGTSSADSETQYVSHEIDVWTGESGDLKLREGVTRFTPLPNQAKPAAVFLGVTDDGKRALFQISSSVLTLSGDGVCLMGVGRCDMISLAPGKSASLVFGPNGVTYAIKLVRINRVVRDA